MRNDEKLQRHEDIHDMDNHHTMLNCVTSVPGRSTNLGFRFKNKGDPENLRWILKHLSEITKEV